MAIHVDKKHGVSGGFWCKKILGGYGKPEPFVREKSQCSLKLKEVAGLAYRAQPPSYLESLYEFHSQHGWSTLEDRNVGPDWKTSMT